MRGGNCELCDAHRNDYSISRYFAPLNIRHEGIYLSPSKVPSLEETTFTDKYLCVRCWEKIWEKINVN